MNSLSDLRNLLVSRQIEILDFNGWQLRVGEDTWVMIHDQLYLNGEKQNPKQKDLFDKYKKVEQNVEHKSNQTRKWRGISSRNYRGK
jgi:hypothetical protein